MKKGSIIIATTVTKENLPPPSAAGPSCAPKKASKVNPKISIGLVTFYTDNTKIWKFRGKKVFFTNIFLGHFFQKTFIGAEQHTTGKTYFAKYGKIQKKFLGLC